MIFKNKELAPNECIVLCKDGSLSIQKYIATLIGGEQCVLQAEDNSCYIVNTISVIDSDYVIKSRRQALKDNIKEAKEYISTQKKLIEQIDKEIK